MIDEMRFLTYNVLHIVLAGLVFVKGENTLLRDALAGAVIWARNTLNDKSDYYHEVSAEPRNRQLVIDM